MVVEKEGMFGSFKTKVYDTKIKNIVTTTTDLNIAEELENRIWQLSTDETPAHLKSICEHTLLEL